MPHSVSPRLLVSAPRKVTAPKIIKKKIKPGIGKSFGNNSSWERNGILGQEN